MPITKYKKCWLGVLTHYIPTTIIILFLLFKNGLSLPNSLLNNYKTLFSNNVRDSLIAKTHVKGLSGLVNLNLVNNGKVNGTFDATIQNSPLSFLQTFFKSGGFNPRKSYSFKQIIIEYQDNILYFLNQKNDVLAKFTLEKTFHEVLYSLIVLSHSGSVCNSKWTSKSGNHGSLSIDCFIDYEGHAFLHSTTLNFVCAKPSIPGQKKHSFSIDPPSFINDFPTNDSVLHHMLSVMGFPPSHPISFLSVNGHKVANGSGYEALKHAIDRGLSTVNIELYCSIQASVNFLYPFIQAPFSVPSYPVFLSSKEYKRFIDDPVAQEVVAIRALTGNHVPFDSKENASSLKSDWFLMNIDGHKCGISKGKLHVNPHKPIAFHENLTFIYRVAVNIYLLGERKLTLTLSPFLLVKDVIHIAEDHIKHFGKEVDKKMKFVFYGFDVGECKMHEIHTDLYSKAKSVPLYLLSGILPCASTKATSLNIHFGSKTSVDISLEIYLLVEGKKYGPYSIHAPYNEHECLGSLKESIAGSLSDMGVFVTPNLSLESIDDVKASHGNGTRLSSIPQLFQNHRRGAPTKLTFTPHNTLNAQYVGDNGKAKKFKFDINSVDPTDEDLARGFEEKARKNKYMKDGHLHRDLHIFDTDDKNHTFTFQNHHLPKGLKLENVRFQGDGEMDFNIKYTNPAGKTSEFPMHSPYKMPNSQFHSFIRSELSNRGSLDPDYPDIIMPQFEYFGNGNDGAKFWETRNPTLEAYSSDSIPLHGYYNGKPINSTFRFKAHTPLPNLESLARDHISHQFKIPKDLMNDYDFSLLSKDGEHTYTKPDENPHKFSMSFGSPIRLSYGDSKYCFIKHPNSDKCVGVYPELLGNFSLNTLIDHLHSNSKGGNKEVPDNLKLSGIVLKDGRTIPVENLSGLETLETVSIINQFPLSDIVELKFSPMDKSEVKVINLLHKSGDMIHVTITKTNDSPETVSTYLPNVGINTFKTEMATLFSTLDFGDDLKNIKVNDKPWNEGTLFAHISPDHTQQVNITFESVRDSGRKFKKYIKSLNIQPKGNETISSFFNRALASPLLYGLRPNESYKLHCVDGTAQISGGLTFDQLGCEVALDIITAHQEDLPHLILREAPTSSHTISGNIDQMNLDLRNYISGLLDTDADLDSLDLDFMGSTFKCPPSLWTNRNILASLTLDSILLYCTGDTKELENKLNQHPLTSVKITPHLNKTPKPKHDSGVNSHDYYPLVMSLNINHMPTQLYSTIHLTKSNVKDSPAAFFNLISRVFEKSISKMVNVDLTLWISNVPHRCSTPKNFKNLSSLITLPISKLLSLCSVSFQLIQSTGGAQLVFDVVDEFQTDPSELILNISSSDDSSIGSIHSPNDVPYAMNDFLLHHNGQDVLRHPDQYRMNISFDNHPARSIPVSSILSGQPGFPGGYSFRTKSKNHPHAPMDFNKLFPGSAGPHHRVDITLERPTYFNDFNGKAPNEKLPNGVNVHENWGGLHPMQSFSTEDPSRVMHGGWSVESAFSANQLIGDYPNIRDSIVERLKSKLGPLENVTSAIVIVDVNGKPFKCNIHNISQLEEMDYETFIKRCVPPHLLNGNPTLRIRVEYNPYSSTFAHTTPDSDLVFTSSAATLIIELESGPKYFQLGKLSDPFPKEALDLLKRHKDGFHPYINGIQGNCFLPTESVNEHLKMDHLLYHCGVDDPAAHSFTVQLIPYKHSGNAAINVTTRIRDSDRGEFIDRPSRQFVQNKPETTTLNDIIHEGSKKEPTHVTIYQNGIPFSPSELPQSISNVPISSLYGQYNVSFEPDPFEQLDGDVRVESLKDVSNIVTRLSKGDLTPNDYVFLCNDHSKVSVNNVPDHMLHMSGSILDKMGYTLEIIRSNAPVEDKNKGGSTHNGKRDKGGSWLKGGTIVSGAPQVTLFSNLLQGPPEHVTSLQTPIYHLLNVDDKALRDAKSVRIVIDNMPINVNVEGTDWGTNTLEQLLAKCGVRDLNHKHSVSIFVEPKDKPYDVEFSMDGTNGFKESPHKVGLNSTINQKVSIAMQNSKDSNGTLLLSVGSKNHERLIDINRDSFAMLLNEHPSILDVLLKVGVPQEELTSTHSMRLLFQSFEKALKLLQSNNIKIEIEIDGNDLEHATIHLDTKLSEVIDKIHTLSDIIKDNKALVVRTQLAVGSIIEFTVTSRDFKHALDGGLTFREILLHGLDSTNIDSVVSIVISPPDMRHYKDKGAKR